MLLGGCSAPLYCYSHRHGHCQRHGCEATGAAVLPVALSTTTTTTTTATATTTTTATATATAAVTVTATVVGAAQLAAACAQAIYDAVVGVFVHNCHRAVRLRAMAVWMRDRCPGIHPAKLRPYALAFMDM